MAEYKRGLKAGIVSGALFGIINAIIAAFIYWFLLESIPGEISEGLKDVGIYTITLLIPGKIIFGIIGGAILGLIFAAFYNKLPGSKLIVNGMLIAIVYWAIFSVFVGYFSKEYYLSSYGITYIADVTVGLIMYLFWGLLLVSFWIRFSNGRLNHT